MSDAPPRLDPETVQSFVANAHGDLDVVRSLLADEPALVYAAWDWGGGDWETGLGAAAHMGRRDIALFLLENGGDLEVVRAMLAAYPAKRDELGPHGIPLVAHARAGGDEARAVLELLETVEVTG